MEYFLHSAIIQGVLFIYPSLHPSWEGTIIISTYNAKYEECKKKHEFESTVSARGRSNCWSRKKNLPEEVMLDKR